MTKPFTTSAAYYDAFYQKKNYAKETGIIHSLIQRLEPPSKKMVDLGCGTGEHALFFTKLGYSVVGVDSSKQMLRVARDKIKRMGVSLVLKRANVTTLRSSSTFGVATSLFHVFSYLKSRGEIMKFFASVYSSLEPGGIFIFDCWYGPGVLHSPPETMTKKGRGVNFSYVRTKIPTLNKQKHTVRVVQNIKVAFSSGKTIQYQETHLLHYYFYNEVQPLLTRAGFVLRSWGVMKNKLLSPGGKDWSVLFVVQKPTITRVLRK